MSTCKYYQFNIDLTSLFEGRRVKIKPCFYFYVMSLCLFKSLGNARLSLCTLDGMRLHKTVLCNELL